MRGPSRTTWSACTAAGDRHIALLIDHLQALPHDLVHSLLLALRSAYMEREADAARQLVAVVTGGMNLVGLSAGSTSPFNIAKPVTALPLTEEQTLALAQATLAAHDCAASAGALRRIVQWACGDRYLVPRLCAWGAEVARGYRQPLVTQAVVDRAAARLCAAHEGLPPIREAIRMIEEDPDTMLDVLHLLDHESLPRARARQMITRTGTDRLQLSGAVVLADGRYTLLNQAYRQALAGHFTTERVAHVLRIAGRWNEAIEYLAPRLAFAQRGGGEEEQGGGGRRSRGVEERKGVGTQHAIRNTQYAIRSTALPAPNSWKPSSSRSTPPTRWRSPASSWSTGCGWVLDWRM